MDFIIPLALVVGGLVAIFYLRPKIKNSVTEIKYMQTKSISELNDMFKQMDENGLGNEYREFVELKGTIVSDNLVETPFSNRQVAYCESKISQVVETTSEYRDKEGNLRTEVNKKEIPITDEKSSQEIYIKDSSSEESVIIEINASGCKLDIPKTFDRLENRNNLGSYRYFNSFSLNRFGADTIGFKLMEKTIDANQSLYVIGEAFRVGNVLHIGKPQEGKKPFIVTTKSEEDLVNSSDKKALWYLVGGIATIVIGIVMFVAK